MVSEEELDAALYDLFILGCYRWRQADPAKEVTPAYPVLGALWMAGCYRETLNRPLTTRDGLRNRVQLGSHIAHVPGGTKASPENMAAEAIKAPPTAHLVMLVRPKRGRALLQYSDILGLGGYPFWLTVLGMVYAAEVAERYPELTEPVIVAGAARFSILPKYQKQV